MELKPTKGNVDISTLRPKQKTHKSKAFFKKLKQRKVIVGVILIITIPSIFVLYGKVVYQNGYQDGKESANNLNSSDNPTSKINNPFTSTKGKVASVTSDSITIDASNGQKLTLAINSKTKIIKQGAFITQKDIKVDQTVTVLYREDKDVGPEAIRTIIE